jgi:hypothetical protein
MNLNGVVEVSKNCFGPCHGSGGWLVAGLLTAEARVHARVNECGIYDGQSGTGTGFSLEFFSFPVLSSFHCRIPTHFIWGMNNMSGSGSSSEMSHPIRKRFFH